MGAAKNELKGLASYCKAETTFTFHLYNLTLSNASLGIHNREIKSESGVSFAIASQPFEEKKKEIKKIDICLKSFGRAG